MKYILITLIALILIVAISLTLSLIIKKYSKLNKKRHVFMFTTLFSILTIFICLTCYVSIYNHADKSVKNYLISDDVTVKKEKDGYYFDGKGTNDLIIFYPGAKVEYTSYAPLMHELASSGIDTFLVKMPFNMAMFGENKASKIIKKYNYNSIYVSGHSLGGVVASSYASKTDKVKGVILLASYSTKSLSNKEVLSIYGTNDGVLDKKAYDKNKSNLPNNYTEYVIDGANHSQFGLYGLQKKDKEASISFDTQLFLTVNKIIDFVNKDDNKD